MSAVPRTVLRAIVACLASSSAVSAQTQGGRGGPVAQGTQLDLEGKGAQARELFQKAIDTAPTPAAKANAQRAMAMSWAFEGNCRKTIEYEQMIIDYWVSQERTNPGTPIISKAKWPMKPLASASTLATSMPPPDGTKKGTTSG